MTQSELLLINDVLERVENNPLRSTRISDIWLFEEKFVYVECKENVQISIEDAMEDTHLTKKIVESIPKWGLIVDVRTINSISKGARNQFAEVYGCNSTCTSVALIIDSLFSRIISNFYINFSQSTTPTRAFTSKKDAILWTMKNLKK